jgi:hypothetical protein
MANIFMMNEEIARGMVCFFHQKKHSYLIPVYFCFYWKHFVITPKVNICSTYVCTFQKTGKLAKRSSLKKLLPSTLAGFDLTTLSSNLLGDSRNVWYRKEAFEGMSYTLKNQRICIMNVDDRSWFPDFGLDLSAFWWKDHVFL